MRPRKVVIVVDDNAQRLSIWTLVLSTRGYRVITFANGQEAIEYIRAVPPLSVDLLMAEVCMKEWDGNRLVKATKIVQPRMPTLLISAYLSESYANMPADVFLPKGVSPAEVLERIKILVARKRGPQRALVIEEQMVKA